jgi:hypothetical protein
MVIMVVFSKNEPSPAEKFPSGGQKQDGKAGFMKCFAVLNRQSACGISAERRGKKNAADTAGSIFPFSFLFLFEKKKKWICDKIINGVLCFNENLEHEEFFRIFSFRIGK